VNKTLIYDFWLYPRTLIPREGEGREEATEGVKERRDKKIGGD